MEGYVEEENPCLRFQEHDAYRRTRTSTPSEAYAAPADEAGEERGRDGSHQLAGLRIQEVRHVFLGRGLAGVNLDGLNARPEAL